MIRASVERCLAAGEDRRTARGSDHGWSTANWQRLADAGVLGLAVSAASGGMGDDRMALLMAMEALGRGAQPRTDAGNRRHRRRLLDAAGDAAQQATVLEPLFARQPQRRAGALRTQRPLQP